MLECTLETAFQYPVALTSTLPAHNNRQMQIVGTVHQSMRDLSLKRLLRQICQTGHRCDRLSVMDNQSYGTEMESFVSLRGARRGFPQSANTDIGAAFRIVSARADRAQGPRG